MFEAYQFLSAMPFSLIRIFAFRTYSRTKHTLRRNNDCHHLWISVHQHNYSLVASRQWHCNFFVSYLECRFSAFHLVRSSFRCALLLLWSIRFRSLLLAFLIVVPNSWSVRANSTISFHLLHRHSHAHLSHIMHSIIHIKQIRIEWPGSFWYSGTNTPIYVSIHLLCSFIMHQL